MWPKFSVAVEPEKVAAANIHPPPEKPQYIRILEEVSENKLDQAEKFMLEKGYISTTQDINNIPVEIERWIVENQEGLQKEYNEWLIPF